MIQNLVWATGYNVVAIPIAIGVLVPWGIDLPMAVGAVAMSALDDHRGCERAAPSPSPIAPGVHAINAARRCLTRRTRMSEKRTIAANEDPACGMTVDVEQARVMGLTLDRDGHEYAFCGKGCMLDFRDEPTRFLDPDYRPHR